MGQTSEHPVCGPYVHYGLPNLINSLRLAFESIWSYGNRTNKPVRAETFTD